MRRFFSLPAAGRALAHGAVFYAATTAFGQAPGQAYPPTAVQGYVQAPAQSYPPAASQYPALPSQYPQTSTPAYGASAAASFGQPTQNYTAPAAQSYSQMPVQGYQIPGQNMTTPVAQATKPTTGQLIGGQAYGQGFGVPSTQAAAQPPARVYLAQNGQPTLPTPAIGQPPEQPQPPQPPQAGMPSPSVDSSSYGAPAGNGGASGGMANSIWSGYGAISNYGAGDGSCGQNGGQCGVADTCAAAMNCGPNAYWQIHAGALLFFRDDANRHTFSFDSAIETNQYNNSRDANFDFLPGVEVGLLRWNCCTQTGWEGLYWGLFPSNQSVTTFNTDVTGNLDPILDFSQLDYNGASANNFANAAAAHRLTRYSQINNAELNRLWGVPFGAANGSLWSIRTLAGFRYFNFNEGFEFAADTVDANFTGDVNEIYYRVNAHNNLYGGQFGVLTERRSLGGFSLTFGAKAGVACNDASATSWIGGAAGTATINNGPLNGQQWLVNAKTQTASFIGELQLGGAYQLPSNWRILANYRVVGVTGLALPTNQIYAADIRGINDVQFLSTNGNLFLHGVFVGAEKAF